MYKYILAAVLSLAVATPTPALAGHQNNHHRQGVYNNHNVHHHIHRHRQRNNDNWVVPLIGGVILGAVINEANKPRVREREREVVVVRQRCEPVTIVVQDQWGRTIERRTEERCVTVY